MRRATNSGSSTPRSHRSRWLSPDHDTLAALLRDNIDSAGSSSYSSSSSSSSSDGSGPRSLACSYFPFRRTTTPAGEPTAALVPGGAYTLSSVPPGTSRDPGSPLAPGSPLFGGPAQSRDPMLARAPRATVHSTQHGGLTTALASSSVAATAGESNSYGYSGTASASAPASVSSSRWDNGGGGGSGRAGGTVGDSGASGASGSRTAGGRVLSLTERNLRRTSGFYEYLRTERDRARESEGAGNGGLTRRESLLATLNEVGSRLSGERR
ncbi:uncharacterized protein C8A04DRAFT_27332 [Dichotomopilus funicola]|uniref:Uncharacterized protein n=1 Tax=Dichotomopilus funicola TaxID=1934379 RepID=A0AAN6V4W3_9PEZI|nr:hypothetical protein C8A04DRAFT_27332 [Dichotomopilus funicola]